MTYTFDEQEADRACVFFEQYLVHVKGERAGQPLVLEPWQADDIIRPLFGWKREDGTRRYRTAYIEIPRKNGKSTLAAGLALYLLLADREAGAEVYGAAADKDQAGIVYNIAKHMAMSSQRIGQRVRPYSNKTLLVKNSASFYRAVSAEANTKHGYDAHGVIVDELHVQKDGELWDVLTTSTGSRRQPMTIAITTAGHDRNSVCWEQHEYALRVREGEIEDDTFLPVVYAADPEDDWTAEDTWRKANPNLGVSVKLEYLKEKCAAAQLSPARENAFRRLHLNQWTEQDVRWLPMEAWDRCPTGRDPDDLLGRPCFMGLDLSTTQDITALTLFFPEEMACLPFFWIPEDAARQKEKQDRVPYIQWNRDGLVEFTPGNVIDYDFIRERVNEIAAQYDVGGLLFDPWNAMQLAKQLESDGFKVVKFGQTFRDMTAPSRYLERCIINSELSHFHNPVLRWMASNVTTKTNAAENIMPIKSKSANRIDGIVGLIMAMGGAILNDLPKASVYESRGAIIL